MSEPDNQSSQTTEKHLSEAEKAIHHHTELPDTAISRALDGAMIFVGKAGSWLWLVVIGVIIYAVVGRYAFGVGSVTLEEWQWHLAGAGWLLGLAYTLSTDDHVRVDVVHERLSQRTQAWIELFGLLLLLMPFLGVAIWETVPFALQAWRTGEESQSPAGLPHRWILKSILCLSFVLLMISAVARLTKVTALLFRVPTPRQPKFTDEGGVG